MSMQGCFLLKYFKQNLCRLILNKNITQQFILEMGDLTFTLVVIRLKIAQQLNNFDLKSVASGAKSTEAKSLWNAMIGQYQPTEKG